MVIVSTIRNPWLRLLAIVTPLLIFGVIYLTVIRPDNNTANHAINQGLQQVQRAVTQAQQQVNNATKSSAAQSSAAASQANTAASQAVSQTSKAEKLAACVSAAGTNTGQLQACEAKYTP